MAWPRADSRQLRAFLNNAMHIINLKNNKPARSRTTLTKDVN
jgi:hypothetical protein